jgi:hypothetical protein
LYARCPDCSKRCLSVLFTSTCLYSHSLSITQQLPLVRSFGDYWKLPLTSDSTPTIPYLALSAHLPTTFACRCWDTMYTPKNAIMSLQKRENMGYSISPTAIIFLVILGSGFLVCCGFAIFRLYGDYEDDRRWTQRSPAQDAYMREVRERSWNRPSRGTLRNLYGDSNQSMAHAPLSTG